MKQLVRGAFTIAASLILNFAYAGDGGKDAKTKTVTVDDATLVYRTYGDKDGTPLVLLAPLGFSLDDWDPAVVNGLARNSTVILFDNKGVGASTGKTPSTIAEMAKDAASFVKALGYSKVDLLGFSMGGFVAQQIIETEPQLVNKLILVGTGPQGAEFTAVAGWAQPDPAGFERAKNVTNPVLIFGGQYDFFLPVSNPVKLYTTLPNARLVLLPDAGHASFFQYPELFVQETGAFLKNRSL